jgi:DNA-binding MarR family transcriptional regulator
MSWFDELPPVMASHAGYLSIRIAQLAQRSFEEAIAPLGLRPQLFDVLAVVDHREPLAQQAIGAVLGIDPARMVALIDELEGAGLLVRRADPADRRRRLISLTAAGRTRLATATQAAAQVEAGLLADLTDEESQSLRNLMGQVLRASAHQG